MAELVLTDPQPFLLLAHHARLRPGAVALSTIGRDYTYEETAAYAASIASQLRQRGISPGDVVLVQLRNEFNLLFMEAVFHEAGVFATYPGTPHEAGNVTFDWLVAHAGVDGFDAARTIIVDDEFMAAVARAEHLAASRVYDSFESVCRIAFSSGTTGRPLAVPATVARQARPAIGWLESRPFFSLIGGFGGSGVKTACASIFHGDTYVCPGEPDDNVTLAQRNLVATLQGSPVQLTEFLDALSQRTNQSCDLATVQYIGSFCPPTLLARIRDELGASITACYGSSEIGMIAMRTNVVDRPEDVGAPLAHITLEIVDERDRPLPAHVDGTVRVRSARRRTGYFRAGPETRGALRDGWFYPGDVGHLDDDGHLVLTGRASEVINVGGTKFHPEIADGLLIDVEGIADGAIIALRAPDGAAGYAAVVVATAAADLSGLIAPLTAACGVAPVSIVRVDSIERDPNGKVRRAALAARVGAMLAGGANTI